MDKSPKVKRKEIKWMGSSLSDLRSFPKKVTSDIGHALDAAQCGEEYQNVKPLRGFGGRSVLEVVANYNTDTWRAVYTVNLGDVVYVLHTFQKKATKGIETPKREIDLIKKRLTEAKLDYAERKRNANKKQQ